MKYGVESGIIDIAYLQNVVAMKKREEILKEHPYDIWQGKDGKWRTYLPDAEKGRKLVKRTDQKSIEDVVIKFIKDNSEEKKREKIAAEITLVAIFPEWLKFKQLHTQSTSYIRRISADWKRFYAKQVGFINTPLCSFSKMELDKWAHEMIKKFDMTKKIYYNMSIILRQCLDYAVQCGYIEENVFADVKINSKMFRKVKKKAGITQVYTESEEERFIGDMMRRFQKNPRNTAPLAVILSFEIGVRIAELCALKFSDIEGNYIHIQRQEVRDYEPVDEFQMKFKGYKIVEYTKSDDGFRDIYLTETARKIIELARHMNAVNKEHADEFIFVHKGKNINHYSIQAMIVRGCEHVKMDVKSSHKIRKTYISTLIDSGLNIDAIRRFAGHSDERTTYGNYCYNRLTDAQTEKVVEKALNSKKVIKGNQIFGFENAENPCKMA